MKIHIVLFDPVQFYTSINPFWVPLRAGILQASSANDTEIVYHTPTCNGDYNFDMLHEDMSSLLQRVFNASPSGVILALPDYEPQAEHLDRFIQANIPIVLINAPSNILWKGISMIGSCHRSGGEMCAKSTAPEIDSEVLLIRHLRKSDFIDERCEGIRHYLRGIGHAAKIRTIFSGIGLSPAKEIETILKSSVNARVFCFTVWTGNMMANYFREHRDQLRDKDIRLGCFDLTSDILIGIREGYVACTIDSQPFLMGFEAITMLSLYLQHGIIPPTNIKSGPYLIDKENIDDTLRKFGQKR
ncbi:MAG: substrate-binding domain-containing protein [Pseudomonadota bacterium]|nr:substrate-binding domain-containing protein [Pseudomonadota bacterium]